MATNITNLALIGFGNVGQAFARLLLKKQSQLSDRYGIDWRITAIATGRHGKAIAHEGIDLEKALALAESGGDLSTLSSKRCPSSIEDFIRACPADLLFENSPVNYQSGMPALGYLRIALERKMHVITANKGPIAHGYAELMALAEKQERQCLFESTVMDGAPVFSLIRRSLPAVEVVGFMGVFNSTTNFMLGLMEQGMDIEAAVSEAQRIGIAETDPSGDIEGWDSAVKSAILVNVLWNHPLKPEAVDRQGILSVSLPELQRIRRDNKRIKLICSASRQGELFSVRVAPQIVDADSPFYSLEGTSSMIQIYTDVLPALSIIEGNPSTETTAYGLLADFITCQHPQR